MKPFNWECLAELWSTPTIGENNLEKIGRTGSSLTTAPRWKMLEGRWMGGWIRWRNSCEEEGTMGWDMWTWIPRFWIDRNEPWNFPKRGEMTMEQTCRLFPYYHLLTRLCDWVRKNHPWVVSSTCFCDSGTISSPGSQSISASAPSKTSPSWKDTSWREMFPRAEPPGSWKRPFSSSSSSRNWIPPRLPGSCSNRWCLWSVCPRRQFRSRLLFYRRLTLRRWCCRRPIFPYRILACRFQNEDRMWKICFQHVPLSFHLLFSPTLPSGFSSAAGRGSLQKQSSLCLRHDSAALCRLHLWSPGDRGVESLSWKRRFDRRNRKKEWDPWWRSETGMQKNVTECLVMIGSGAWRGRKNTRTFFQLRSFPVEMRTVMMTTMMVELMMMIMMMMRRRRRRRRRRRMLMMGGMWWSRWFFFCSSNHRPSICFQLWNRN